MWHLKLQEPGKDSHKDQRESTKVRVYIIICKDFLEFIVVYIQLLIIILGFFALKYIGTAETPHSQSSHKKYVIFMMFLLTLQSGLRNVAVGTDTYAYYLQFVEVSNTSWSNLLNKVYLYFGYSCMDSNIN